MPHYNEGGIYDELVECIKQDSMKDYECNYIKEVLKTEWERPRVIKPKRDNKMENLAVTGNPKLLKALAEQWEENGFERNNDREYDVLRLKTDEQKKQVFSFVSDSYANKTYNVLEDWQYLSTLTPEPTVEVGNYIGYGNVVYRIEEIDHTDRKFPYKVKLVCGEGKCKTDALNDGHVQNGLLSDSQVEQALIKEAKRRFGKIKDGDRFKVIGTERCSSIGIIRYNWEYYKDDDILYLDSFRLYDSGQWAELVNQTPDITINGYEAEFYEDYVQFGRAKIDKRYFVEWVKEDSDSWDHLGTGNRSVTGIRIGEGVFSLDDIKKIAQYYD